MAAGRVPSSPAGALSSPLQLAFVSAGSWAMQSNPSQDGTIAWGTMSFPSKWFDTTAAIGNDYFGFKSGKNGGGIRELLSLTSRGSSLGDDVAIGFAPASGATYTGGTVASPNQIQCLLLPGSVYQFRFKPANTSAVATEVLRLDGATLVTSLLGGCVRPMIAAVKTANYTMLLSDYSVKGDTTAGAFTITLPDATTCAGQEFEVKRINVSANLLTVKSVAGTLDGAAAATGFTLATQYQARILRSDGTNWHIIAAHL